MNNTLLGQKLKISFFLSSRYRFGLDALRGTESYEPLNDSLGRLFLCPALASNNNQWRLNSKEYKHTAVFYIRITTCSKTVRDTWENLDVICCFDLNQDIFRTPARFHRESLVSFCKKVVIFFVIWMFKSTWTNLHKRATKVLPGKIRKKNNQPYGSRPGW